MVGLFVMVGWWGWVVVLWFRMVGFRMVGFRMVVLWFGMVVLGFRMMITGFVIGFSWGSSVAFTPFTVDGARMVTGAQVFVEDGSVGAMEGVLFPIRMAIMVDLQ